MTNVFVDRWTDAHNVFWYLVTGLGVIHCESKKLYHIVFAINVSN